MPVAAQLPSLTGLRAAAAAVVLLSHLRHLVPDDPAFRIGGVGFSPHHLLQQGNVGVSLFFVLSGFVLMWTRRPDDRLAQFWLRRAARIYPAHLVVSVVSIVLVLAFVTPHLAVGPAAASLVLVQSWVVEPAYHYWPINAPTWSLAVEVFFYACFPAIARWLVPAGEHVWRRTAWVAGAVALAVPIGCYLALSTPQAVYWSYVFPPARLAEFVLGASLALLVGAGHLRWVPSGKAALVVLVAYLIAGRMPRVLASSLLTVVPFAFLIVSVAWADLAGRRSFWRHPVIQHLGRVSFAVYLVQWGVIDAVRRRVGDEAATYLGALAAGAVATAVILLLAEVLHFGIERPAERWIRRRWSDAPTGRSQPAVAAESA